MENLKPINFMWHLDGDIRHTLWFWAAFGLLNSIGYKVELLLNVEPGSTLDRSVSYEYNPSHGMVFFPSIVSTLMSMLLSPSWKRPPPSVVGSIPGGILFAFWTQYLVLCRCSLESPQLIVTGTYSICVECIYQTSAAILMMQMRHESYVKWWYHKTAIDSAFS